MCRYEKIDIFDYRKNNPETYNRILEQYSPIFDKWVAVAMYLNGDEPPTCTDCGERLTVRKKQHTLCNGCRYVGNRYTFSKFMNEYKGGLTALPWKGKKKTSDKITLQCKDHGNLEQALSSALKGHGCQECYFESKVGIVKYTDGEWMEFFIEAHGATYSYDLIGSNIGCMDKIEIVCPTHGKFEQRANLHKMGHGCKQCANELLSLHNMSDTDSFIRKAIKIHGDTYNYDKVKYTGAKDDVEILCNTHGIFLQKPNYHLSGNGCPDCGFLKCGDFSYKSTYEYELLEYFEELGVRVVHSYRDIGIEIDILLPEHNIGIEFNGNYWHSEKNGKGKKYHIEKTMTSNIHGIHLIHLWEYQWNNNKKLVKSRIKSLLSKNSRIYARKCKTVEISPSDSAVFMRDNHIQGNTGATYHVGLEYDSKLVAVMTFGKPRYSKKVEWELIRFCNIKDTNIIGGASKLYAHFCREMKPKSVISYSDRSWNTGNLYEVLGFTFDGNTEPSYRYTKNYKSFFNRTEFQKHKLETKIEIYHSNLTEWENMKDNGYDRIWDCGNSRWKVNYE